MIFGIGLYLMLNYVDPNVSHTFLDGVLFTLAGLELFVEINIIPGQGPDA